VSRKLPGVSALDQCPERYWNFETCCIHYIVLVSKYFAFNQQYKYRSIVWQVHVDKEDLFYMIPPSPWINLRVNLQDFMILAKITDS